METSPEYQVLGKQFPKKLNLAKKSLKKLKLLNAQNLGLEGFDRDDLIMIIHTFSWSALEGFANFLLNVVEFTSFAKNRDITQRLFAK